MGFVTIIEIDHDQADKLREDPAFFGQMVYRAVVSGDALTDVVRIPGGRIIQTFSVSAADPINLRISGWWKDAKQALSEIVGRKIL